MPRAISSALAAELAKVITSVGYFVEWGTTPIMRWSNIGAQTWDGNIFAPVDFAVRGLNPDADAELSATIEVQNLDSAAAAVFLGAAMPDVTVQIWQFAAGALASGDVPKLAVLAVDDCEITDDAVVVQLREPIAFAPRRRIDPSFGFNYALPAGSVIAWEGEIFVAEPADG